VVGGAWNYQMNRATQDVPLDLLFTAGAGMTLGDDVVLRVPFGVVAGHRFALDGDVAITPYVHPRLSMDLCPDCTVDESSLGIDFTSAATSRSVRRSPPCRRILVAGTFGTNGVGSCLAPPGLRRSLTPSPAGGPSRGPRRARCRGPMTARRVTGGRGIRFLPRRASAASNLPRTTAAASRTPQQAGVAVVGAAARNDRTSERGRLQD
jgi:hypothetical protein